MAASTAVKIVPLGDKVVLKRQEAETTTSCGIVCSSAKATFWQPSRLAWCSLNAPQS